MNYFDSQTAAKSYASGRPFFHPQVIQRIKKRLRLKKPLAQAVDVGCGTGLSTLALLDIASQVIGTDISAEMLALAPKHPRVTYLVAPAEDLPLPDESVNLLTVSSALHWINGEKFLVEARRIIQPMGWLVVYDNNFTGKLQENPAFQTWIAESFLKRYPTPSRASSSFTAAMAQQAGFSYPKEEKYQNVVTFTSEQLVNYLLSQSNTIAAVKNGDASQKEIYDWLSIQIAPFFGARTTSTFLFRGTIWYLQKR